MRGKRTKVEELTCYETDLASGGGRPLPRKMSESSGETLADHSQSTKTNDTKESERIRCALVPIFSPQHVDDLLGRTRLVIAPLARLLGDICLPPEKR